MQFDLSSFSMERTDEDLFKSNYQMLNIAQLYSAVDTLYLNMFKEQDNIQLTAQKRYYYLNKFLTNKTDTHTRTSNDAKVKNQEENTYHKRSVAGMYDDKQLADLSKYIPIKDTLFKIDTTNIDTNFINNFPEKYRSQVYDAAVIACKNQKEYVV